MNREQIDADPRTVAYKTELYALRNRMLDYLVDHDPDQELEDLLNRAEALIREWIDHFHDYLVTDDEYYSRMTGSVLKPVYRMLSSFYRETTEDELERVEKERDEAVEALERIKRDINRYYGLDV